MAGYRVNPFARKAFQAGSASLTQFQFVQVNSSDQIVTPAASGVFCWVLDDAPALSGATITNDMPSGGYVVGAYYGCINPFLAMPKVIAGASLSANAAVTTDTSGHAVAVAGSGVILGYTVAACSSGDIVQIAAA